jgi:hypothetical protein
VDGPAAAFAGVPGTRRVHENAAHHPRRHREKLGSLPPIHLAHVNQAEIDLMDQRGGLKGIPLALVLHEPARHEMQLAVDPFRQAVQGCGIAIAPGFQEVRDVGGVVQRSYPSGGTQKMTTIMASSAARFRLYRRKVEDGGGTRAASQNGGRDASL